MRKTITSLFALALGFIIKVQSASALPKIEDPILFKSQLQNGLPGMGTSTELTFGSTGYIGQMIKGFYDWGLTVGGILAAIMIMAGGVLWLTSAGSSDTIGKAKKMITGSIIGILLLVGAWMILKTINPALVDMSGIDINHLSRVDITYCCDAEKGNVTPNDDGSCEFGSLCQGACVRAEDGQAFTCLNTEDYFCCQWKNKLHPNVKECKAVLKTQTCPNEPPYPNFVWETYTMAWCYDGRWVGSDCTDKTAACDNQANAEECGDGHEGYCYNEMCWEGDGQEGEPCGTQEGSECYDGNFTDMCAEGYEHDTSGRDCDDGLYCCHKKEEKK